MRGGEAYPCGTLSLGATREQKLADFFNILLGQSIISTRSTKYVVSPKQVVGI